MKPFGFAIVALLLLAGNALRAAEAPKSDQVFWFENKPAHFNYYRDRHLVISAGCKSKHGGLDCAALRALPRVSRNRLPVKLGGADPGAVACTSQVQGVLVVGADGQGGEKAFCLFKDASMVSTGTLDYYSQVNDER